MYHIFFLHFCLILKEKIIEHKQIDNLYQISNYFIYICLLFIIDIFKIVNKFIYFMSFLLLFDREVIHKSTTDIIYFHVQSYL